MLTYTNSIPDDDAPAQGKTLPSYHGPPDPNVEKLTDRSYTRDRSRMVDRWLEYREMEGF